MVGEYMKKLRYLIFSLFIIFSFNILTMADSIVIVTEDGVRIRSLAGTSGDILGKANKKDEFDLIDLNKGTSGNGCTKDWIIINNNGTV